jgi:hypothetical protein
MFSILAIACVLLWADFCSQDIEMMNTILFSAPMQNGRAGQEWDLYGYQTKQKPKSIGN